MRLHWAPPSKAARRLWLLCLFFALGSFEWGFNVGILSSILVHPGFKSLLGWSDSGQHAGQKGMITATYYLGTLVSYIFLSQPLSDRLGRRRACLAAVFISGTGIALQAAAFNGAAFGMLVLGRLVTGMGSAVMSTSVPMYQRYVVMNHIGFIAGLASGFWVGWAVTFWISPFGRANGWRVSLCVQYIPAIMFALGLPFVPETPRWLLAHGQAARARASLSLLRDGIAEPEEVETELRDIKKSVVRVQADIHVNGFLDDLWLRTKDLVAIPPLRARLWRAILLHFMGQMCGATAMKYYLPTLFESLGLGTRVALMAGGIESLMKIPMNLVDAFIIDRFGRRWTLTAGCGMMAAGMAVNAIIPIFWTEAKGRVAAWTAVVFIFVYAMGYSVGFGPATWVYSSEIFPTHHRSRGLNLAASGGSIGSLLTAQIWPVGVARIHQYIYFYFAAINILCIPIIWLLYPETARVSLEDMDALFGSSRRYTRGQSCVSGTSRLGRDVGTRGSRRLEEEAPLTRYTDGGHLAISEDDSDLETATRNASFPGHQDEAWDEEESEIGWDAYTEHGGVRSLEHPTRCALPLPSIPEPPSDHKASGTG